MQNNIVDIDFETISDIDIKKHGAWIYSRSPNTHILCLCYSINHGDVQIYIQGITEEPLDLFEAIRANYTVVAHNAGFERSIWRNICVERLKWPSIKPTQWKCSAAKAAAFALPRPLGKVGKALNLPVIKDEEGSRTMLKLSKYRKPTKHNTSILHSNPEDFKKLYAYCATDVLSEIEVDKAVPDLTNYERQVWLLDQRMNFRGIPVDIDAVNIFIKLLEQKKAELLIELEDLTLGEVTSAKQVAKSLEWLKQAGFNLPNLQKATVIELLEQKDLNTTVKRFLEIRQNLGKSATDKFEAMRRTCDTKDNLIRDYLMYHGASTGRWSGKFVQFQNMTRGDHKNTDKIIEFVKNSRDLETIEMMYGDIFKVAASCVRGMICAEENQELIVADFAAIECRVLLWCADGQAGLDIFRRKEDIYKFMAQAIYGIKYEDVTDNQRFIGKTVILGCGYGIGREKFLKTCQGYKIDLEKIATEPFIRDGISMIIKSASKEEKEVCQNILDFLELNTLETTYNYMRETVFPAELVVSQYLVGTYRASNPEVLSLWYGTERAAIQAVLTGEPQYCGKCIWHINDNFLLCRMPSGRDIAFAYPELKMELTPWGKEKYKLYHWAVDDKKNWRKTNTFGARLVENLSQSISRDLMADAMLVSENSGMPVILTVHDELITKVKKDSGKTLEDLVTVMTTSSPWAEGLPLAAEGWTGKRYKK